MVLIPILFGAHHSSIAIKEKDMKFNANQVIILTEKLYDVIKTMCVISNRIKYSMIIYLKEKVGLATCILVRSGCL